MAKIVLTAKVEDAAKWEKRLRTHGELLKTTTSKTIYYTMTKDNEIAMYAEVADVAKYFEVLGSPAIAESMAYDGVKRETVKTFVLDKEFKF
jgi:hypothetical protein